MRYRGFKWLREAPEGLSAMKRYLLLMLMFGWLLNACSVGDDLGLAEDAVRTFHRQLNAGRFEEIYDSAAREFMASDSKRNVVDFLRGVQRRLGKWRSASKAGWEINYGNEGTLITLTYRSEYEGGRAMERFVFRIRSEKAELMKYDIRSKTQGLRSI
jgi:hypothetical protein